MSALLKHERLEAMSKINSKSRKAQTTTTTAAAKPAKLPKAKRVSVLVGKLAERISKTSLTLAKHGDVTQAIRVAMIEAVQRIQAAQEMLAALPDDALVSKRAAKKVAIGIGNKVMLTDKAREQFADVLTADEAKATFEVVAVNGGLIRIKSAGGNVLFLKRSKLTLAAPAPATTPAA